MLLLVIDTVFIVFIVVVVDYRCCPFGGLVCGSGGGPSELLITDWRCWHLFPTVPFWWPSPLVDSDYGDVTLLIVDAYGGLTVTVVLRSRYLPFTCCIVVRLFTVALTPHTTGPDDTVEPVTCCWAVLPDVIYDYRWLLGTTHYDTTLPLRFTILRYRFFTFTCVDVLLFHVVTFVAGEPRFDYRWFTCDLCRSIRCPTLCCWLYVVHSIRWFAVVGVHTIPIDVVPTLLLFDGADVDVTFARWAVGPHHCSSYCLR